MTHDLDTLRILDNNAPGLASLRSELSDDRCQFFAGDVRDRYRLSRAMNGVDLAPTAAMKHVDICEYNPFGAVKTNTLGLQKMIDAAVDVEISRFEFTSSDKAVDPANTMGTTKLLGEKLVNAGNSRVTATGGIYIASCSPMEILLIKLTTADNKIVRMNLYLDHPRKANLLYGTATTAPTADQRTERVLL